ncbi:AIM24 family protein [Desulfovibrio sp.]|uniref:AIM24 family protein n=1 Tax=Desulfovibrio sp. TaxID=885 RepID=UPI0025BA8F9C|nr:AIM24 family protein [Desulfovibrio sp.]
MNLHIEQGKSIQVREHQFLAATQYVEYEFERVSGISNMLFGSSGLFIDKFRCIDGDGILWLHGYGNVFEVALEEGEMIDVEPGAWLYKDGAVKMDTNMIGIASGFLSSTNIAMNRFTGPGRVGIQSMYIDGAAPPRGSEKK